MTKTNEVNEMMIVGLEISLQQYRIEMDDITFRRNNLRDREETVKREIEILKDRINSLRNEIN